MTAQHHKAEGMTMGATIAELTKYPTVAKTASNLACFAFVQFAYAA
jgi:hypothetical protein